MAYARQIRSTLRAIPIGVLILAAGTSGAAQTTGAASSYPTKPIRLVVPSAPGGGTDIIARLIAQALGESWGQTVVVDNRGGAGGIPGVAMVAKQSAPDGYTMLLGSVGHISFAPAVRRNLGFNPDTDLTPVSLAANQPFVITAALSVPANSIKDLIALAKAKPRSLSYGSGGTGTASHLGVELLQLEAGFSMLHVPYKGSNPAIAAVMGGDIQVALAGLATALPHAKTGKLKALAVTGAQRSKVAPDLPTVAESGVPRYVFDVWYGIMFPGGTPQAIVAKTHGELTRLLKSPAVSERFATAGLEPLTSTPKEFSDRIKGELPKWQRVAKEANIRID
jgi:tripartite-type tricarboxylate transporter receptor subunit TctC